MRRSPVSLKKIGQTAIPLIIPLSVKIGCGLVRHGSVLNHCLKNRLIGWDFVPSTCGMYVHHCCSAPGFQSEGPSPCYGSGVPHPKLNFGGHVLTKTPVKRASRIPGGSSLLEELRQSEMYRGIFALVIACNLHTHTRYIYIYGNLCFSC